MLEATARVIQKLGLIVFGMALAIGGFEIVLRMTDLNLQLLRFTLFYSPADYSIYENSETPFLSYQPKPGAEATFDHGFHPEETLPYPRRVKINSLGFRSPERPAQKSEGVFRIFIFGGSNTYGISVSDENAYPQKLQNLLDKTDPGRYEVWNGGITAGVLSQSVEYARRALKEFSPDLIVIQDYINFGRRPFLVDSHKIPELEDTDVVRLFELNPEYYQENIPLLVSDHPTFVSWHRHLVRLSATYRFLQIAINTSLVKMEYPHHHAWDCRLPGKQCSTVARRYATYGEHVNDREFQKFRGEAGTVPIVLMDPINRKFCSGSGPHYDRGVRSFSICGPIDNKYGDMHPPAYVYDDYAKQILKFLRTYDLLPLTK